MEPGKERKYWLDRKENVNKVYWCVWVMCGLAILAEPFVHKHGDLALENWFGFHGWYGFVACVVLVIAAKGLRVILKRPENYYERN